MAKWHQGRKLAAKDHLTLVHSETKKRLSPGLIAALILGALLALVLLKG